MSDSKRNIYLNTTSITEAIDILKKTLQREELIHTESIPSHLAHGRVLAQPVHARFSSPTCHSAAMDGVAVRAADTFTARDDAPVTLTLGKDYAPVNTGYPLPPDAEGNALFDAVIMIEHIQQLDDTHIQIEAPVFPWQHVRRLGEDIVATELLFPHNHCINAYDIGTLLAAGIWEVEVWQTINMRIIPTGDEVIDFTHCPSLLSGQVVESNSQVLMALAATLGIHVERVPPIPDDPALLRSALKESLNSNNHITVFCAGSSAGSRDYTRATIETEGDVLVHGIAAMPGKPSILGVCHGKLVAGAPGYPVSSVVCFEELLTPLIAWLAHKDVPVRPSIEVELTRSIPSRLGIDEFVRLSVGRVGTKLVATPLARGAGNTTTLSRAQAVTCIPADTEGVAEHQTVKARLTVAPSVLERTVVCVGSHDNTLDLLADALMGHEQGFRLASTHVGSMGGLTALRNHSCHMAGAHLFDPETNDFNFPFIERFLSETPVTVVNVAIRHQGIIVAAGNPLGITSIHDIAQASAKYINRQRGAGTRILFDWHLKQAGIKPNAIMGYDKEEYTHMAVAANIRTGAVDCGLGIYAAARALELDFIPLAKERYDLIFPTELIDEPCVVAVLELLRSPMLARRIQSLGGYETTFTGTIMKKGIGLGAT